MSVICSCEDELDITLSPKARKIVINSFFNDEDFFHVNISENQPSTDNDTIYFINNACVLLYKNDVFLDTLKLKTNGNYYSDKVIPETGVSYNIKAEVPGISSVATAVSQIPVAVKEVSLDTSSIIEHPSNIPYRQVTLRFKDIANTQNYYLVYMIWVATRYVYDADSNIIDSVKREAIYGRGDGFNLPGYNSGRFLFTDQLMDGDTIEKNLFIRKDMYGANLGRYDHLMAYFRLCTISEDYYLYARSYTEQHSSIDYSMFSEPVSVYTNIQNGEGIFAGYGQCIDSLYYAW